MNVATTGVGTLTVAGDIVGGATELKTGKMEWAPTASRLLRHMGGGEGAGAYTEDQRWKQDERSALIPDGSAPEARNAAVRMRAAHAHLVGRSPVAFLHTPYALGHH